MSQVTRRDFIKIAFTTISATVLNDPVLAQLLPREALNREIADAADLAIDCSGYLYDPNFDYVLPTYREMLEDELELAGLTEDEQVIRFAQWHGYEDLDDPDDHPYTIDSLDEEVNPEFCSPYWLATHSEWRVGIELYESLDEEACEKLGLVLVDGEHPGSDFMAVRCDKPDELQEALWREGMNIAVR